MIRFFLALWLAVTTAAAPAMALDAAPATASPVDPARLAAAQQVVEVLFPVATREQMIDGMMQPMLANIRQGLNGNAGFAEAFESDPRLKQLFDQFMQQQQNRMVIMLHGSLPGMTTAMARAYARRFDLAQLGQIKAFFETPTGQAYMRASVSIMSDPDIAAWQQSLLHESMSHIQEDIGAFAKQAAALEEKKQ